MRRTLLLLVLFAAACSVTPDAGTEPVPSPEAPAETVAQVESVPRRAGSVDLTVPDAVMLALARNPDIGITAARILAARATLDEARAAWYPRFDLALGYTYTNDPVLVFMSTLRQRELTFDGDFNRPGGRGNLRASAELSWLVWDGGRREAGEDMARIGVRLEEAGRDVVLNELKAAVLQTCLAVFEAEEFIHVAEESLDLVGKQLSISKTLYEEGAAQRSDVLSVEVRQAEMKEDLVRAKNARERALASLRELMGLSSEEPFSLVSMGGFRVPEIGEQNLVAVARENRPEIRRAEEAILATRRAVTLEEAHRMPTVSAFGSYDIDDEGVTPSLDADSATAGVRVDLNVFEGYRSRARIAGATARVREAEEMARKVRLHVEAEVTRAQLDLAEARERLLVSETTVRQAEEVLSLIGARYETGAATITEYLDAEVARTGARVREVAARFGVERATAALRRALGICRVGQERAEPVTGPNKGGVR